MFQNTSYKTFVAKAATSLMTELLADALDKGRIDSNDSFDDSRSMYEHLALHAGRAAEILADTLKDSWSDGETTFFDVEDSPTSKLEEAIANVGDCIGTLIEVISDNANLWLPKIIHSA